MLRIKDARIFTWPAWGLMALMAATRFHHFGDFQTLPDASLAVFFLAGLFVATPSLLPVLMLEAGSIDYLATTIGGVSDWCITPAYLFLIPTYAVMWLGGSLSRRRPLHELGGMLAALAILGISTCLAFLISNGSFYLFSGYFEKLTLEEYLRQLVTYLPPYVATTTVYATLILAGSWLWQQLSARGPAPLHK